jgi:hypothetical protein
MFLSSMSFAMGTVVLAWLVISMVPADERGWWVAPVLLGTYLPGLVSGFALRRLLGHRTGRALMILDSGVRAACMGGISVLHLAGELTAGRVVALVAVGSVTLPWGRGGAHSLIATLVGPKDRLPVNSWVMSQAAVAAIAGPALGGVLAGLINPALVPIVDGSLRLALILLLLTGVRGHSAPAKPSKTGRSGWGMVLAHPELRAVLLLGSGVAFMYGVFEVALPLFVASELRAGSALLGVGWAAFGTGAAIGTFLAGFYRNLHVWQVSVLTTFLWAGCTALAGVTGQPAIMVLGMFLAGLIYTPFQTVISTFIQGAVPIEHLAAVAAAWTSAFMVAPPLGHLSAGPLAQAFSPGALILLSSVTTAVFGLIAAILRPPVPSRLVVGLHEPADMGLARRSS